MVYFQGKVFCTLTTSEGGGWRRREIIDNIYTWWNGSYFDLVLVASSLLCLESRWERFSLLCSFLDLIALIAGWCWWCDLLQINVVLNLRIRTNWSNSHWVLGSLGKRRIEVVLTVVGSRMLPLVLLLLTRLRTFSHTTIFPGQSSGGQRAAR